MLTCSMVRVIHNIDGLPKDTQKSRARFLDFKPFVWNIEENPICFEDSSLEFWPFPSSFFGTSSATRGWSKVQPKQKGYN